MSFDDSQFPGRGHYEGVRPDWDTDLGPAGDVGFVVVVHQGRTIVAPLHHVRTQIHSRFEYKRLVDVLMDPPTLEILFNVRGISDHYRIYEGSPEDFVNGTGRYADDREQAELEIAEQELIALEDRKEIEE
jgi:hypothetical protein